MREVRTEIDVDAPPETVWEVLTDFDAYGEWNPLITDAAGGAREGVRIDVRVEATGARPVRMRPRVTVADPGRTLQWVGSVVHPWLFEGLHTFELEAIGGGRTRVTNRERFGGLLAALLPDDVDRDYRAMNRALAARAEQLAAAESAP